MKQIYVILQKKQQLFYQAKKIQPPKQKENKQKIEYISRHSSIFFSKVPVCVHFRWKYIKYFFSWA